MQSSGNSSRNITVSSTLRLRHRGYTTSTLVSTVGLYRPHSSVAVRLDTASLFLLFSLQGGEWPLSKSKKIFWSIMMLFPSGVSTHPAVHINAEASDIRHQPPASMIERNSAGKMDKTCDKCILGKRGRKKRENSFILRRQISGNSEAIPSITAVMISITIPT